MPTPYTRMLTSDLNTLSSSTLGSLKPYQVRQVYEFLSRVNWGNATTTPGVTPPLGMGSDSDVSAQPTITQIITMMGSNNP
jgi:hypothetical protein